MANPKGKINALEKLDTLGVSLVKRGANKRTFAVAKSENAMDITKVLQDIVKDGTIESPEKIEAIVKSEKLSEKGAAALEAMAKLQGAFSDEAGLKEAVAKLFVEKADEGNAATLLAKKKKMEEEEEAKKAKEKAAKKPADNDGDEDDMEAKKVRKSLEGVPAEIRAELETLWSDQRDQIKKANEQVVEMQKVIKAETDARVEREWLAKAEKHLTHVPGKKPADLAKMLKKTADLDADMANVHYETFKAASEAVKKSAQFREMGVQAGANDSANAWDQIVAKAQQLVEKGEGKLSTEQAIEKVCGLFPDLYRAHEEEQRARVRG